MISGRIILTKARYYSSVMAIYAITLLFGVYIFKPSLLGVNTEIKALDIQNVPQTVVQQPQKQVIQGKPNRIVVSKLGLDLTVYDGRYNPADNSWTLFTGHHAYFALPSKLANDTEGNTIIYGHNNKYVFGRLKTLTPGDQVQVYTDNNYLFSYTYQSSSEVAPDDVSIFHYQGPPILTIQTCSGNWHEKRKMYTFTLNPGYKL